MEKRESLHTVGKIVNLYSHCRNSLEFSKKKIEQAYDPTIPFLGIYLKTSKPLIQKYTCTLMFIAASFKIANKEQTVGLCGRRQGWDDLRE